MLAGTVMALRMISTSERRIMMLVVLAMFALLLAGMVLLPTLQPKGMSADDVCRLVATLGVWVAFVLAAALSPVRKADPADELGAG
ncbi:MAG: hypothetical protein ABIW03_02350 [Sphingomicrobium sp.]